MSKDFRWWSGLGKELEIDLESQDGFNDDVSS